MPSEMALGVAARLWCEPSTERINMIPELAELFAEKVDKYHEIMDLAWGVIANAGDGDWEGESAGWRKAAVRWREKYHAMLDEDLIAAVAVHVVEDARDG